MSELRAIVRCDHRMLHAHSVKDGKYYTDPYWREADEHCPGGREVVLREKWFNDLPGPLYVIVEATNG